MPQRADAAVQPSVEIDVDNKYVVELMDLTEQQAQFDNSKEGDMSMTWKFRLFDQTTGVAVIDHNQGGDIYELWNFTSDKTYFNPKTGKKAKAREWTEALLGRDLTDDEMNDLIDLGFADSLKGRRGLADLEWYVTKGGNERLRIIRLRPYKSLRLDKKGQKAAAPTEEEEEIYSEPDETPASVTQTKERTPADRAAARARLGLDDAA